MKMDLRIIRALLAACALLQLGFFALAWSGVPGADSFVRISPALMSDAAAHVLSAHERIAGALVGLPSLLALGYGLWRLHCALVNIEGKAMFGLDTIGHVRAFAGAALASTLLAIVETPLRALVYRFALGLPGQQLSVGLTGDQLLLILVCALFYLIIRLMHEARRLAEENEGFV